MLNIAMAQIRVVPGRPDINTETIIRHIGLARERRAELVVFPEMAVPGYLLGDTWEQPAFLKDCEECGRAIIASSAGIGVIFGNVALDRRKRNFDGRPRKYNALFAAFEGRLLHPAGGPYPFVIKSLMPDYREFDDSRYFFSLPQLAQEMGVPPEDLANPVSMPFRGGSRTIGCMICEDAWSDSYGFSPAAVLGGKGADFLINISSSPFTLGKNRRRHDVFGNHAARLHRPFVYVNCTGLQNNGKTVFAFDGSSTAYRSDGRIAFAGKPWKEDLYCLDIDRVDGMPESAGNEPDDTAAAHDALAYGIRHFLAGINMGRVVIGVSGGIDSAVAAALYTEVLGPENVLLLNMPGEFNSALTKGLAGALAENLGCRYAVIPIGESVAHTIGQMEQAERMLKGMDGSVALKVSSFIRENIQARDRSSRILAAAAAAFGGGFTCNANKAEMTVGYSTLYGDQSGFLAALGDLWKHQVYDMARYLNDVVYGREAIPQGSIEIVPSAELSPQQNVEEGRGDPLCYPYHDRLFAAFAERWERASPEDILAWYSEGTLEENIGCEPGMVEKLFPSAEAFITDLERWWNLYAGMGVAKRIQAPPVLAVSRRAYGFDHREAQNGPYYTAGYRRMKERLLSGKETS